LNQVNELIHDLTRETDQKKPEYRVMAKGLFM
jgi:hypothetical protein